MVFGNFIVSIVRFPSLCNDSGNFEIASLERNIIDMWILSKHLFSNEMAKRFLGP